MSEVVNPNAFWDQMNDEAANLSDKPLMGKSFDKFLSLDYNKPMIVKLFPIPTEKDAQNKMSRAFTYQSFWYDVYKDGKPVYKNGKVLRLSRPSMEVLGENDPQGEYVRSLRDRLKELKKDEEGNAKAIQEIDKKIKKFGPTTQAIFLVQRPKSAKIEALRASVTLCDALFGRGAYGDKPPVEGLITKMLRDKLNPYAPRENTGWLVFEKTGTTFNDTKYTVAIATVREGRVQKDMELETNPEIFTRGMDALPNPRKMASYGAWTKAEVEEYLASKGSVIPASVSERMKNASSGDDSEPAIESFEDVACEASVKAPVKAAAKTEAPAVSQDDLDLALEGI